MSWVLICGDCSRGLEIKSIGIIQLTDQICANCGRLLPMNSNEGRPCSPWRSEDIPIKREAK